jgi:formylglycine-generating enzyme required for sulfatase activity
VKGFLYPGVVTVMKSGQTPDALGSLQHSGMAWIPGVAFHMGSEDFHPEERPVHEVSVDGFWMDCYEVTNEQFARFVDETRLFPTSTSSSPTNPPNPLGHS